jgi:2-methylcitrate dehydratase PrpD
MTEIEWLAEHLTRHRDSRPGPRRIAMHVLDAVGALAAGGTTAEGRLLRAFFGQPDHAGEERVGRDLTLHCALARLSEIDDIHREAMVTPGGIVVPAVLTLARSARARPAAVCGAVAAGYEAMIRLGRGINGPAILARGIWPTYFVAPFAVAAAAARLWELDVRQTAHALALSLSFAAPAVGRPPGASGARWLAIGHACGNGLAAAAAARSGFVGDLAMLQADAFARTRGFAFEPQSFRVGPDTEVLDEVSFKPWCAAKQTMSAVQALRTILQQDVGADDVERVTVRIPPAYAVMIGSRPRAGDRGAHLTSVQYQLAVAALAPESGLDVAQDPGAAAERLYAFADRINVEVAEELQTHYPSRWPAELRVLTRAGESRSLRVFSAPGDPETPLTQAQLMDKFRRLVSAAVTHPEPILQAAEATLNDPASMSLLLPALGDAWARGSSTCSLHGADKLAPALASLPLKQVPFP